MKLRRAAIVAPLRTPVGRFGGALAPLGAGELAAVILRAVIERSRIDPAAVDDVVFGQGYASGEAPAIGRWAWLAAGFPESVPGFQLDRRCGSGLQAIIEAAMMVQTGAADVVVAGGVESMSNVEHYSPDIRRGARFGGIELHDRLVRARAMAQPVERYGVIASMVETADTVAREAGITREAADEYAAASHRKAAAAWEAGRFERELVPLAVPQRRGEPLAVERDEGIRPDTTAEGLARLPAIAGGVTTAGNASQQNDAAAACLVVSEDRLAALGLEPMGFLEGWAAAGCDPARMGLGPVPAVRRLFARHALGWDDLDLVELNEAFAGQVLAVLSAWGWSAQDDRLGRLNVNGSGISLGHPIGVTGARIVATLLHEMTRRSARRGLVTMCIGGGQGLAAVFTRE